MLGGMGRRACEKGAGWREKGRSGFPGEGGICGTVSGRRLPVTNARGHKVKAEGQVVSCWVAARGRGENWNP